MTRTSLRTLPLVLAVAAVSCTDMDIPDLNNPSVELLVDKPTPSAVQAAATGLEIGQRAGKGAANGLVSMVGILGRESYNFDSADPRYTSEMLAAVSLDPGSPAFGGNFWTQPYANIRNANTLLLAIDKVGGFTDAQKNALRGWAKTIQALDFLTVVNLRDVAGGPIDVGGALDTLGALESKEALQEHVADLLDEAKGHLEAGGDAFPFPLSSGFDGFNTPATFLKFNRAVKARVDVYRKQYAQALIDLRDSFLDDTKPLTLGVYMPYGDGSGDVQNGLISPNLFAHPSIVSDADHKLSTAIDDRVTAKITTVTPRTVQGVTSDKGFKIYTTGTSPIPIIRNEELILIRAEASIGIGEIPDAADDINFIRRTSGGLPNRLDLDASNITDELLKQRRYSLLWEGGHRWIDARRFGKLDTLPLDLPTHHVHNNYPIPTTETDARK